MKKREVFLITHTHWDREWYLSLDQYRFRLVRLMDGLLDILAEQPDYHSYWLDGQTIPIEDYLAVRPERRDALMAALRSGKILIGPWYVSADEFMVAGEACIRNLLLGCEQMRAVGQENPFGYLADIFGHVSQMPQILRGFGIDNAIFWRGYVERSLKGAAEQAWTGADGSRIIAVCLVRGYSSACQIQDILDANGNGPGTFQAGMNAKGGFLEKLDALRNYCQAGPILLLNGVDHALPLADLPRIVSRLEQMRPDLRVTHASFSEYIARLRGKKLPANLPRGEMRYVPGLDCTASARIGQKVANARCEDLLIHYAEPLNAWAAWLGKPVPPGFLRRAWKLLLKNHSHDTLSGVHADSVAMDMATRFRRIEEIGGGIVRESLARLTGEIAAEEAVSETSRARVYQPCGWARQGVVEMELDLPASVSAADVRVSRGGTACPTQLLSAGPEYRAQYHDYVNPTREKALRVRLLADLGSLPAMSLSACDIRVQGERTRQAKRERKVGSGNATLDNGLIRARIHPDGSFDLVDLRNGLEAMNLNVLRDEPDDGTLYHFLRTVRDDRSETSSPSRGKVEKIENGPLRATCRVKTAIPSGGVEVPLTIAIALLRGEDFVRVRAQIDNRAVNHRLCATFRLPGGFNRMWAHTPFDVVERKIHLPQYRTYRMDNKTFQYDKGWLIRPMQAFVAAVGRRGSLFCLCKGQHEYFQPQKDMLHITLLRSTGLISPNFTMHESGGGQCLGQTTLAYAVGLTGQAKPVELLKRALEFRLPPRVYQTYGQEPAEEETALCSVSQSDWVISAIKRSEDGKGVVVRVFSLASKPQAGALTMGRPVSRAWLARLDETKTGELPVDGSAVRLRLSPKQILTVIFEAACRP
ncbi:MAG: glycoside hydrolase family 38 C-terminal domain-containing protein [Kiritimatiellae bacterium]|nr:glycoside hydrolase family 38 C-terminal domain-containing protein [Kiritimatiellia bacterium]